MQPIVFYSTDHCSLCDEAFELVLAAPAARGRRLTVVDIASSDELLERYADSIPVLVSGGRELAAPFGADDLDRWLRGTASGQAE